MLWPQAPFKKVFEILKKPLILRSLSCDHRQIKSDQNIVF